MPIKYRHLSIFAIISAKFIDIEHKSWGSWILKLRLFWFVVSTRRFASRSRCCRWLTCAWESVDRRKILKCERERFEVAEIRWGLPSYLFSSRVCFGATLACVWFSFLFAIVCSNLSPCRFFLDFACSSFQSTSWVIVIVASSSRLEWWF